MKNERLYLLAVTEKVNYLDSRLHHKIEILKEAEAENKKLSLYNFNFLTVQSIKKFNEGKLSADEAEKKIRASYERKKKKVIQEVSALFEAVESSEDFTEGKIEVEWTKSRTWGLNPHAVFLSSVNHGVYTDSASGCGYDKLSSAIAGALNQCLPLKKAFFSYLENCLKDLTDEEIAGLSKEYNYRKFFPYGTGYSATTFFEGGVGVSCYDAIFKLVGLDFKHIANGKTYDVFTIEKTK